jgi:hypothetical protein
VATLTWDADRKSPPVNHIAEDFDVERPRGTQLAANNLRDDLRPALTANGLEVDYQPIVRRLFAKDAGAACFMRTSRDRAVIFEWKGSDDEPLE